MHSLEAISVDTGSEDSEGCLVRLDGKLVGVLVRLAAPEHGDLVGRWFLEAGFGPLRDARCLAPTAEEAVRQLHSRVAGKLRSA